MTKLPKGSGIESDLNVANATDADVVSTGCPLMDVTSTAIGEMNVERPRILPRKTSIPKCTPTLQAGFVPKRNLGAL